MLYQIQAGELAKWLRIVRENGQPGALRQPIPPQFVDHLTNLRVARLDKASGQLVITEKGLLSLHMDTPDAMHKQVDPDDIVSENDAPAEDEQRTQDALENEKRERANRGADEQDEDEI